MQPLSAREKSFLKFLHDYRLSTETYRYNLIKEENKRFSKEERILLKHHIR